MHRCERRGRDVRSEWWRGGRDRHGGVGRDGAFVRCLPARRAGGAIVWLEELRGRVTALTGWARLRRWIGGVGEQRLPDG
eukprot:362851-Chlamydomonas_euryale.AAC.3